MRWTCSICLKQYMWKPKENCSLEHKERFRIYQIKRKEHYKLVAPFNKEKWNEQRRKKYWENPEKFREANRKLYNSVLKEKRYENHLKWDFGITIEEYDKILAEQDGRCAICGSTDPGKGKTRFSVDHDHKTGKVRGLLCDPCNNGIARFNDNTDILKSAIYYITKFKEREKENESNQGTERENSRSSSVFGVIHTN
jgi:hypothetical protein